MGYIYISNDDIDYFCLYLSKKFIPYITREIKNYSILSRYKDTNKYLVNIKVSRCVSRMYHKILEQFRDTDLPTIEEIIQFMESKDKFLMFLSLSQIELNHYDKNLLLTEYDLYRKYKKKCFKNRKRKRR